MKNRMKHYVNFIINGVLLKPFNLRLSYNLGSNPIDDMKRLLQAHTVTHIVDGGAYRGDFSLQAADAFPAATVYSFEPLKSSFALLTRNTATVRRIKPVNCALGSASENATFYTNASPLTNSLSKSTADAMRYFQGFNDPKGVEHVEVTSLHDFLSEGNMSGIDILKLDLQGHELQAIQGLGDLLSSVNLIYSEVQFLKLYDGASLFSEVETMPIRLTPPIRRWRSQSRRSFLRLHDSVPGIGVRIEAPTYENLYRGEWLHPKLTEVAEVASTG